MAPAGCRTHRHVSHELLQNMIISYIIYITSHLGHTRHMHMPCKNKLDVLYFVVASFTWLLRATYKNRSYLRKATTVIYKLPFNHLHGPPLSNQIMTKVGETDTCQPLYAIQVTCQARNRSLVRGQVKLVWAASIPQYPKYKITKEGSKLNINAHNKIMFYSCKTSTHRSWLWYHWWESLHGKQKNFLRIHPRSIY